jgi:hypothetical protein
VLTYWLQQLSDVLTCSTQLITTLNSHTKVRRRVIEFCGTGAA